MATRQITQYAPRAEDNPWRVDTFMNADEWKEVSRWYPFSLRSLMPDGRWFEWARCKMRDDAYQIMKALAARPGRGYYVIVRNYSGPFPSSPEASLERDLSSYHWEVTYFFTTRYLI